MFVVCPRDVCRVFLFYVCCFVFEGPLVRLLEREMNTESRNVGFRRSKSPPPSSGSRLDHSPLGVFDLRPLPLPRESGVAARALHHEAGSLRDVRTHSILPCLGAIGGE